MANPPPVGRWMRMATLRPMSNPTQDPPSPQPPAPRPVLGRTFTAVPFRPAVATASAPAAAIPPAPAAAIPPAPVVAPPRQGTPTLPVVTAIRPPSVRLAAGTNGAPPPPQGALDTTAVNNAVPSPQRAPIAATVTDNVPSPQRTPVAATVTNGVPSPQRAPNASTINGVSSPQRASNAAIPNGVPSPQRAPATVMPNFVPSPQPAPLVTEKDIPTPQKIQFAPSASPMRQRSPMFKRNGVQQPLSPQTNAPPAPPTTTIPSSPFTREPYAPNFVMPKSPSQQPSTGFSSPTASPSTKKQADTSPNFTSAPAPRMVTFSNVQAFSSPTKSPVSPAASMPRIPSPIISPHNGLNPPERTPPQSPQTLSMAHPPSPLHLPPPQLRSDTEQDLKFPPEPEQKSILFQHSPEKHKHSSIKSYGKLTAEPIPSQNSPQITKPQNDTKSTTKDRYPHKKLSDSEDIGRSIITIAGQNRGALMDLGRPRNTHPHPQFPGNPHKLTSPNSKISGSESDQSSGSSGKSKAKDAISAPMKAFMNSNVQGINNSIMFNSTVTHNDPGVHVALSRKHNGHGGPIRHYKEHTDGHQS